MSERHLGAVMTANPVTTVPGTSLAVAASAMRERGVGSTLVVENGGVLGILTERDLARAVAQAAQVGEAPVEAWMTPTPVTQPPSADLTHALEQMLDHGFRHLPVCEGRKLVGVVSLRQLIGATRISKVDPWSPGTARGLENVVVSETELSHIDGEAGRLIFRGYNAVDLACKCSFEDVWHLLYFGRLPEDGTFAQRAGGLRELPLDVDTLRRIAKLHGSSMLALQAAISATGAAWKLRPWHERPAAEAEEEALRIAAVVPSLACALWRLAQDLDPVPPDRSLDHAANYLWMMHGEKPGADQELAIRRYFILTAEHGMNASTFTSRVVSSTGADIAAAVAGAAGALSGPLHGGAPSLVLDMLDEIGSPDRARDWIAQAIGTGRRIMGFGHRVYRAEDPRAACLRDTALAVGGDRIVLAKLVETAALELLRAAKPDRALFTNVEFYSAVALERAGIPRELFTPTFAASRSVGWTAHILEQVRDNRLIRPAAQYRGPAERALARDDNGGPA